MLEAPRSGFGVEGDLADLLGVARDLPGTSRAVQPKGDTKRVSQLADAPSWLNLERATEWLTARRDELGSTRVEISD